MPSQPTPAEPTSGPAASRRWSRLAPAIGGILALAALTFVVRSLSKDWPRIRAALADASLVPAFAGLLTAVTAMVIIALGWHRVLRSLGVRITTRRAVEWYFVGEIGKYLPGGVWPVLGRGELARRGGADPTTAYASTVGSLVALYGTAVIGLALCAPAMQTVGWALALTAVGAALGVVAVGHPRVLGALLDLAGRRFGRVGGLERLGGRDTLAVVAVDLGAWLCIGLTTVLVTGALGFDAGVAELIGASLAAWLAGFLAVPVPGGAGIREAVFVLFSGLPRPEAAAVAVVCRLLFVAADVGGFALCLPLVRRAHRTAAMAADVRALRGEV